MSDMADIYNLGLGKTIVLHTRVLVEGHLIVYLTTAGGKCGSVLGLILSSEKKGGIGVDVI